MSGCQAIDYFVKQYKKTLASISVCGTSTPSDGCLCSSAIMGYRLLRQALGSRITQSLEPGPVSKITVHEVDTWCDATTGLSRSLEAPDRALILGREQHQELTIITTAQRAHLCTTSLASTSSRSRVPWARRACSSRTATMAPSTSGTTTVVPAQKQHSFQSNRTLSGAEDNRKQEQEHTKKWGFSLHLRETKGNNRKKNMDFATEDARRQSLVPQR